MLQRFSVALGFVFGVAVLGALAFANTPDVVLIWHEQGQLFIGIRRTDTQQRLEKAEAEISKIKHRQSGSRYAYMPWIDPRTNLFLLARPDRRGRILMEIAPHARDILSSCKLAVADDDVYVEVSYQGETGWVNGWALSPSR